MNIKKILLVLSIILILFVLFSNFLYSHGILIGYSGIPATSVSYVLPTGEVLHYISPTGCDDNTGTAPSGGDSGSCNGSSGQTGPWQTPQHNLKCGDVILASTGSYTGGWQGGQWGTPTNCPSSTGGIDGTGGIQFVILLCAGNIGTCSQNGNGYEPIRTDQSHWAIEGWFGTQGSGDSGGCFEAENDSTEENYVAFINDIGSGCDLNAFGASGGGSSGGGSSFDHVAAVGVIAFNGAQSEQSYICGSGLSIAPGNADSDTQTHIFVDGYFGAYNTNGTGSKQCTASGNSSFPHSDGEGIIFDTYGAGYTTSGFNKGVVLENAVIWHSGNNCVEIYPAGNAGSDLAQYNINHVTCYGNNQDVKSACASEFLDNGIYPTSTGSENVTNNIFVATVTKCGGSNSGFGIVNAVEVNGTTGNSPSCVVLTSPPIVINGNWAKNIAVSGQDDSVFNITSSCGNVFGAPWIFGTITTTDPSLNNPTTLFSTSPSCTAYTNVTSCMNDPAGLNVYGKIMPTVAPTSIGYQLPGPCITDSLYPTWLKGIVFLHWNSTNSTITENAGLVTKPCGL